MPCILSKEALNMEQHNPSENVLVHAKEKTLEFLVKNTSNFHILYFYKMYD